MRHLSLFTGIGGFDLGFDRARIETVGQVESDKYATTVLERHWPDVPRWTDIRKVDPDDLPDFDVLTGGFPCQDISVAGKRAGLAGERSGLWYEFARIIDARLPSWVVVENVPGLLSSNGGRDMGTILGFLADRGYGFAWRVLDAQYFGVAQRRRRVFIVGHLGGDRASQVLAVGQGSAGDIAPSREAGPVASALTANGVGAGGGPDDNAAQAHHLVPVTANTLTRRMAKGVNSDLNEGQTLVAGRAGVIGFGESGPGWWTEGDATYPIRAEGENRPSRPSHIVGTASQVRRLTPTECARLQGFPDDWNDHLSDTQRYRQYGNAVCVPVAEWIGQQLGPG